MIEVFGGMSRDRLSELLDKMRGVRVAVLGDICLDVYWLADMKRSELSRETPHFPLPVVEERMSPGGGGNVAVNLAGLKPAKVFAIGVTGEDWRGAELLRLLVGNGVDAMHLIKTKGVVTNGYCKPLRAGISQVVYEDPRIDFCNYSHISPETEDAIIASLDEVAPQIDVLCVCDQLTYGIGTDRIRAHITGLARAGLTVAVDSRNRIGSYRNAILKPNELEGARAVGMENLSNISDFAEAAVALARGTEGEVLMTLGLQGALYTSGEAVTHFPANRVDGEIDIVGAGDTFLSGFSMAIAAGASRPEAAFFAALCSEVTIQKLGCTGSASAEEVLSWHDRINGKHQRNEE